MSDSSQESKQLKMEIGEPATFKLSEKTLSRGTLEYNIPDDDAEQKNSENTDMSVENCEYTESKEKSSGWSEICRVCANENSHVVPIFEGEGAEHDLCKKIHKYLPIQVSKDDTLPVQLCYQCAATILAWHELLEGCMEAEKRLVRMESELKEKEEMQLKYTEIPSFNGHAGIIIESEELVDDPEPIATHGEEHICSMEKLQEPSETVEHAPSQENEERSGAARSFETFVRKRREASGGKGSLKLAIVPKSRRRRQVNSALPTKNAGAKPARTNDLKEVVEQKKTSCDGCSRVFKRESNLKRHVANCREKPGKDETIATEREPIKKEATVFEEESFDARASEESTNRDKSDSWDTGEPSMRKRLPTYPCAYCDYTTRKKKLLKAHTSEHHSEISKAKRGRKQRSVDKDLVNRSRMEANGRTYYHCSDCGKNLFSPYTFAWHVRIHTGERPFTCHLCGKQFRVNQGLARHLRETHAGIKKFPCDLCGRMFSTKRNVEDHRRIHTGERPFVCNVCGKAFKQKASLFVHNRTHTDFFPFKCSYCEQGFRTRPPLVVHMTKHTGEKPHACDICDRAFRIKYELKRHRLIHFDEKPWQCTDCGLSFRQKRYLVNHKRINHACVPRTSTSHA